VAVVRPPTVIETDRLIAGRHPCAWGSENASAEVRELAAAGVSLFLDLTQDGELEPYAHLVQPPARHLRMAIRDFSVPTREQLVATLDETGWRVSGDRGAAKILGLKRTTLEARMRKLGILRRL